MRLLLEQMPISPIPRNVMERVLEALIEAGSESLNVFQ